MRGGKPGLVFIAAVLAAGGALAHGGATGVVKERMDAMSAIGKSMKSIGKMLKGSETFETAKVAASAEVIAAHSGETLTGLFPGDSLQAASEASPDIWSDWNRFSGYADDMQSAALELKALADADAGKQEIGSAFGSLAGTCKTCHEAFRIKK